MPDQPQHEWFRVSNEDAVDSPALLVYPDRIEENIRRMIVMAGGVDRLRPHIKTHKLPEIMRMQLRHGIRKYKCATIAEAEMAADAGAPDVLIAYPVVGPKVARLVQLIREFPGTHFSVLADSESGVRNLGNAISAAKLTLDVLLDIDCGMHRTGVAPGDGAVALYRLVNETAGLRADGLHAYDGHIHDVNVVERAAKCEASYMSVAALRERLQREGLPVPLVIAGGTPTFPLHARRSDVECSPGTCVFWDQGYSTKLPDMDFLLAALVLTRVVSKPEAGRLCLDLGHKAIAAENPHPRVHFLNLPDAVAKMHSEEHLVVESARAAEFQIGDCLYGVPWHVCPTVALHSEAVVVEKGVAGARWRVTARARSLRL